MNYLFVSPAGEILRRQVFAVAPDQPNPIKGKWVEDTLPVYDSATHRIEMAQPINILLDAIVYNVIAKTAQELADEQAVAATAASAAAAAAEEQANRNSVKTDAFVQQFINMTPAELSTYIANNGGTIAALRFIVNKLALIVLYIAKDRYK